MGFYVAFKSLRSYRDKIETHIREAVPSLHKLFQGVFQLQKDHRQPSTATHIYIETRPTHLWGSSRDYRSALKPPVSQQYTSQITLSQQGRLKHNNINESQIRDHISVTGTVFTLELLTLQIKQLQAWLFNGKRIGNTNHCHIWCFQINCSAAADSIAVFLTCDSLH